MAISEPVAGAPAVVAAGPDRGRCDQSWAQYRLEGTWARSLW